MKNKVIPQVTVNSLIYNAVCSNSEKLSNVYFPSAKGLGVIQFPYLALITLGMAHRSCGNETLLLEACFDGVHWENVSRFGVTLPNEIEGNWSYLKSGVTVFHKRLPFIRLACPGIYVKDFNVDLICATTEEELWTSLGLKVGLRLAEQE